MDKDMIIAELNNRGYEAKKEKLIKNGVELEGIRITTNGNADPIIYTDEIVKTAEDENKSLDEVVAEVIQTYEEYKTFEFDVDVLFDRNFILNNIFVGFQKASKENIEKKLCEDFEGIESYLSYEQNVEYGIHRRFRGNGTTFHYQQ